MYNTFKTHLNNLESLSIEKEKVLSCNDLSKDTKEATLSFLDSKKKDLEGSIETLKEHPSIKPILEVEKEIQDLEYELGYSLDIVNRFNSQVGELNNKLKSFIDDFFGDMEIPDGLYYDNIILCTFNYGVKDKIEKKINELKNKKITLIDYKGFIPYTMEIVNANCINEKIKVSNFDQEYIAKIFSHLRKMNISRKKIAEYLFPNLSSAFTLTFEELTERCACSYYMGVKVFKNKMLSWNEEHFDKSVELDNLLK